ncbi:uncharacterized protein TRIREDRAFT_62979 [Trichoderma reesei QM6a]|uniref:Predicted protein n=2 Tax=Hypocrea jecorina TaxID=51453 RepID=G0RLC5_HYPJQ|nr:uncharacterized protein TRIREDRAFT_62979 [Trichoderma reesei QM6a]EGR47885.1 predicted protein [Trichoderma reesei QM6a]ETS01999.1 histone-fold-containing protein [Trichoderma reesei RUT C-30]
MPYNTNAIPPRKEPTGQTQLPLSRVKKIISQDPDVQMCSNNAAFVITLAAEMFIQHLTEEAHTQAKLERKPRRNIQYKDVANAISHRDHLEFLEDVAPKTIPFKKAKAINQARLRGELLPESASASTNGTASSKSNSKTHGGESAQGNGVSGNGNRTDDPSDQLELEMRQAAQPEDDDADVDMTG